jgi:diguanylate cyclase (GGDEF)-like protein
MTLKEQIVASISARLPDHREIRIAQLLDAQHDVLSLISRNAPLEESLSAIARFSESWIPGMKGSILRYDEKKARLARGGYGQLPAEFAEIVDGLVPAPMAGSCGACAYHKRRVISHDVFTDPLWADFHDLCRRFRIRSAWSSPLIASRDGSLLGVFGMYHSDIRPMTHDDEELVNHFADLAAMAIERFNAEAHQRHQARHDVLTGLGNRRLLEEEGPRWLADANDRHTDLSAIFIDLDNFKSINDTFGHALADELLAKIAATFREHFGADALITRFGGDEFIVLLRESQAMALERLELLRHTLGRAVSMGSIHVEVRFSAGLVECANAGAPGSFAELVSASDEMARRAKLAGGDRCISADPGATQQWSRRHQLKHALKRALGQPDAIDPHLQPIMSLTDGSLRGFEMLLRLRDPVISSMPIGECIAVAEQTGLIQEIGHRMLRAAVDLLVTYPNELNGLYLNVNISVRQLMSRNFLTTLHALVDAHAHLTPRICLEVTESHWLDAHGPAGDLLREIHAMGFKLALDDFGTGHASLSYLQSLPFDSVKMDRHFVEHVETNARDASVCQALLAMAHSCGMSAVAEGVETSGQSDRLAQMGYDCAQGYLYSKPMPIPVALAWTGRHRNPTLQ